MRSFLLQTRESFWFLPTVFGIGAVILAQVLVLLDRTLIAHGDNNSFVDSLSASAARSILTIIGTAMLTVAGTTFSITISVLATTSSTYGPRLVRNFLADRANQIVLAVFTSTFLYALVVLLAVRSETDDGGGFVPTISIYVSVGIGVLDVAVLVFFIHHIADSVQITTLQRRVQTDLLRAIARLYPAVAAVNTTTRRFLAPLTDPEPVCADTDGYVEYVDFDRLKRAAENAECTIDVMAMPGVYIVAEDPLVRVSPPNDATAFVKTVRSAFSIGTARTPLQDVRFALQQLVEVAVRGLASGTNDPYTAVTALDLAATALVDLLSRPPAATALVDLQEKPLVILHWPQADDLIRDIFAGITTYGLEHPLVVDAAVRLAERLRVVAEPSTRDVLDGVLLILRAQL